DAARRQFIRRKKIAEHAVPGRVELCDRAEEKVRCELVGVADIDNVNSVDVVARAATVECHEVIRDLMVELGVGLQAEREARRFSITLKRLRRIIKNGGLR